MTLLIVERLPNLFQSSDYYPLLFHGSTDGTAEGDLKHIKRDHMAQGGNDQGHGGPGGVPLDPASEMEGLEEE